MLRDHQRFANLASGLQSLIVVIAVVSGGIWTVITFGLVDWAEHQRLANSGLSISIDARQEPLPSDRDYAILAQVRVTNRAATPRFINFVEAPLQVQRVTFTDGVSSLLPPFRTQPNVHTTSRVIRSGETVEYPYVVTVPEQGVYRVSLWIKLSKEEYDIHRESGGPAGDTYWDGQTYVSVR